ncbi:hypothetical protein BpHYR1_037403 [Brachionus plicatilis]|uniref:Uncharacterized protein n=1 Tax=Brachionus plicatilis TaxID=10195 RepID=A0A3M7SPR3_BRAPC|nr:hypothetical protein BpHYR1_037403 [Brachionus plicatilis]
MAEIQHKVPLIEASRQFQIQLDLLKLRAKQILVRMMTMLQNRINIFSYELFAIHLKASHSIAYPSQSGQNGELYLKETKAHFFYRRINTYGLHLSIDCFHSVTRPNSSQLHLEHFPDLHMGLGHPVLMPYYNAEEGDIEMNVFCCCKNANFVPNINYFCLNFGCKTSIIVQRFIQILRGINKRNKVQANFLKKDKFLSIIASLFMLEKL